MARGQQNSVPEWAYNDNIDLFFRHREEIINNPEWYYAITPLYVYGLGHRVPLGALLRAYEETHDPLWLYHTNKAPLLSESPLRDAPLVAPEPNMTRSLKTGKLIHRTKFLLKVILDHPMPDGLIPCMLLEVADALNEKEA